MSLRARKKAETLAAIRQAAARLFADKGFAETRTRDIAEAAGIATGTLFNYAPTKEDVVLILWKGHAEDAVRDGLAAAEALDDPVERCAALFRPIFTFYSADLELGRVFLQSVMFRDDADPELKALNEGFIAQIALLVGPWAGVDALSAALNIFAAYFTALTMLLGGRLPDVDATTDLFRQLVWAQVNGWPGTP
jgi:AcrR family transcriptional regulator